MCKAMAITFNCKRAAVHIKHREGLKMTGSSYQGQGNECENAHSYAQKGDVMRWWRPLGLGFFKHAKMADVEMDG